GALVYIAHQLDVLGRMTAPMGEGQGGKLFDYANQNQLTKRGANENYSRARLAARQRKRRHRCAVCQFAATYTGTFAAGSSARPRTWSAPFSPIMIVGAFRLPVVIIGMIEESITRRPSTPITRHAGSTTARGSSDRPIRQVPHG